jgi:hypothetical protein
MVNNIKTLASKTGIVPTSENAERKITGSPI